MKTDQCMASHTAGRQWMDMVRSADSVGPMVFQHFFPQWISFKLPRLKIIRNLSLFFCVFFFQRVAPNMPFETCWTSFWKSLCTFFCLEWFSGTWWNVFYFLFFISSSSYTTSLRLTIPNNLRLPVLRCDQLVLKGGAFSENLCHQGSVSYLRFEDSPAPAPTSSTSEIRTDINNSP